VRNPALQPCGTRHTERSYTDEKSQSQSASHCISLPLQPLHFPRSFQGFRAGTRTIGWLVQVLHLPQKSERSPFWNGCSYGIENDGIKVSFNGMTSLLNFIKSTNWFKSLWGRQTHRQEDDLISLHFSFRKESRLKTCWFCCHNYMTFGREPFMYVT
jgi:hypothetical protein